MELTIPNVGDFTVTGDGRHGHWERAAWQPLKRVGNGTATYATRAKVLYSDTGIYFLVDCEDRQLTCTITQDNVDIYKEDVVEVFLWTDEAHPVYFEYEISPLACELTLLVSNNDGNFFGWLPWHYEEKRKIQKAVTVRGGPQASMARCTGWVSEFYVPFVLMNGLSNVPPARGTTWRANIFRMDHDALPTSHWAWCPDTGAKFHNFREFGAFKFA